MENTDDVELKLSYKRQYRRFLNSIYYGKRYLECGQEMGNILREEGIKHYNKYDNKF